MKIICVFSLFFSSILSYSQVNSKILNDSLELSKYLEKNFYSEFSPDSCYTGIHYITISFRKGDSTIIEISGNINSLYKARIETLLLKKIWDDSFIRDSRKKDRVIIQPIYLDITKNCAYDTASMMILGTASLENISKEKIYELSIALLVKQRLELIESYKTLLLNKKSKTNNYLLLSPCYINARPLKKKTIM